MRTITKRKRDIAGSSRDVGADRLRAVKEERLRGCPVDPTDHESSQENGQDPASRRVIRSQYLALMNLINGNRGIAYFLNFYFWVFFVLFEFENSDLFDNVTEKRDDFVKTDSDKFNAIMNEVERLHEQGILHGRSVCFFSWYSAMIDSVIWKVKLIALYAHCDYSSEAKRASC